MSEELLRQEVARLEARAAMLERQLEAHERAAAEQSRRLEEAISDARIRAEQVARSEEELRQQASILRLVLDSMADGVAVVDEAGRLVLQNPAADRMLGRLPASPEARGSRAPERFDAVAAPVGLFLADQVTPWPATEHPLARALRGEAVDQVELFARPPQPEPRSSSRPDDDTEPRSMRVPPRLDRLHPDGLFLAVTASPMRRKDGSISGAVAVFRDTTEAKRLVEDLEAKNRDLSESEQAKTELVERLRLAIDEVSTPILELWDDVLALPIIGVVDSRRSVQIMERLLDEIVHRQSRFVIIDLTGVEIIDTRTADYFTRLIKAVELLGARCRITGVRPAVAQALVDIGINLGAVRASRTLKHALRDLLRRTGKRIARAIADGRARPALAAGAARKNDDDAALAPRSSQMRPLAGKES
ncbi:MAG: STAS domain-containing protein [Polyangiaceae bacterium]|nr:STAS domain-containing protein [Polyangiaceae bacterium]